MEIEKKYRFLDENKEHLHQLLINNNWKPLTGTSSVTDILAKNLTWWAAELAAVECLEAGEKIPTIREEYLAAATSKDKKKAIDELQIKYPIFKTARFAHYGTKNKAAELGKKRHEECEKYILAQIKNEPIEPHESIISFAEWSKKNVKRFLWSEMHCYSEKLWLGGITDCGVELNNGETGIIDFKSSKEAYPNQYFQIAGYDLQISENGGFTADGDKILEPLKVDFYAVLPFGAENPLPVARYDTAKNQEAFKCMLTLYRQINLIE